MELLRQILSEHAQLLKYGLFGLAFILIILAGSVAYLSERRQHPTTFKLLLGAGVVLALVGGVMDYNKAKAGVSPPFSIQGEWEYWVEGKIGAEPISYGGTCTITQRGSSLRLMGGRQWRSELTSSGEVTMEQFFDRPIPWTSSWASIDEDGTVRFEYDLTSSVNAKGFCRLSIREQPGEGVTLAGQVAILPPGEPLVGSCTFTRIDAGRRSTPRPIRGGH